MDQVALRVREGDVQGAGRPGRFVLGGIVCSSKQRQITVGHGWRVVAVPAFPGRQRRQAQALAGNVVQVWVAEVEADGVMAQLPCDKQGSAGARETIQDDGPWRYASSTGAGRGSRVQSSASYSEQCPTPFADMRLGCCLVHVRKPRRRRVCPISSPVAL